MITKSCHISHYYVTKGSITGFSLFPVFVLIRILSSANYKRKKLDFEPLTKI